MQGIDTVWTDLALLERNIMYVFFNSNCLAQPKGAFWKDLFL